MHSLRAVAFPFVLLVALFVCAVCAHAQAPDSPSLPPAPRSILGFTPGDDKRVASWRQITDYFARLDRASERVAVERIGTTTLGREMIVAYISAPENIRNLSKYKEIQRRLADPRLVRDAAERERLIAEGRAVVAVSCSIHSNEIVASQMSMQLAYELASANDAETREQLRNTILILIPSANPDGVDIVGDWYKKTLGTSYEGTEPPEIYHHYAGHDNNRDWFMLNLAETRHITTLFWKQWFPQIVYDVHQQGQTGARFFIPPFYDPANPRIAPLLLREVGLLGHKIAADLQAAGLKGVVTNAQYDMWWHGGFRTAPYYHNSIGILSEAASARLMSPVNISSEQLSKFQTRGLTNATQAQTNFPDPWTGGAWRPADIMRMEMIAARGVLSLASNYRARYLRNFYELGARAVNERLARDEPLAYLIEAGQGRDEAVAKMIGLLIEQGVEVHRLDRELHASFQQTNRITFNSSSVNSVVGDFTSQTSAREVPAGSYIVFLQQPYRQNVRALFERQVYPNRRLASGEQERPYDVAGWTLPMQMNVEAKPVAQLTEPPRERRLTLLRDAQEVRRDLALPLARDNDNAGRSPIANPLKTRSRIGLYRSWTSSMDEGWTRYVFDTFNVPYKTLRDADFRNSKETLRDSYDVIVLPSMSMKTIVEGNAAGSYPLEFTGGITNAGVESLRRFVEAGGTLVCFDASTEFAIKRFNLPVVNVLENLKPADFFCPGSVLKLDVDAAHPFARGFGANVDAYFVGSQAFDVRDAGESRTRIVARYATKDVLRSGFLLGEKYIAGKSALVEVSMGRGRVVLFGFRPQHRAQTWGTFPFIFNALEAR